MDFEKVLSQRQAKATATKAPEPEVEAPASKPGTETEGDEQAQRSRLDRCHRVYAEGIKGQAREILGCGEADGSGHQTES